MSSKIEKIIAQYEKTQEERERLTQEIESLKNSKKALIREAEEAAKAGNLELFREKRDVAQFAEDTAYVKGKQLAGLSNALPENEVKSAWKEFNEERAKTAGKAMEAYEKARKDLFVKYMALVQEQNEALKIREKFAAAAGVKWEYNGFSNELDSLLPLHLLQDNVDLSKARTGKLLSPDAIFFATLDFVSEDQVELLNSVIRLHLPHKGE